MSTRTKTIVTTIAAILVAVLCFGMITVLFRGENGIFQTDDGYEMAEVQYNPTFGTEFKETMPISSLPLRDSMTVAPYAYEDTTLFTNKKITKIDAPVGTVTAVDENQYFTLYVIKSSEVKVGGNFTNAAYREYKVYLPQSELTSTTVNKWISVDVSKQNIYVGADETLAFMKSDDPVICCYASGGGLNFYYDLAKAAKSQVSQSIYYGIYTDEYVDLTEKKLSVLGDSISTYSGISNNTTSANSTLGSNAVYYPKNDIDSASETWWSQAAEYTNMDLLVNNSWSGSKVLSGSGASYQSRCVQLHDDTGDNAGTEPDVIAVYMGINDFIARTAVGTFNSLSDIYSKENGYITPTTFAEAYAITIHKMQERYKKADVFVFTLPPVSANTDLALLNSYNQTIRKIAEYFDCYVVDLAAVEGYEYSKYTIDGLHPNEKGMDLITDIFARTLKGVYGKQSKK